MAFIMAAVALYVTDAGRRAAAQSGEETAADEAQPAPACLAEPVVLKRFGAPEPLVVSLTDCEQRPNPAALPLVGALAMPKARPDEQAAPEAASSGASADATEPAQALNPELLVRLQQLASRFPDRAIEIVSGYRTRARAGSRHRSGDALDVRIEGVDNEQLSIFARTLEATGVGYYPNSTFVHIDVRAASAYWVDRSGPGEKPQYVRVPAADDSAAATEAVHAGTSADAERDAITGQVERALSEAPDEAHGPELPVADEPRSSDRAVIASEAAPTAAPVAEATDAAPVAEATDTAPSPAAQGDAPADPAELEAELKSLLDRALVVMQQANAAG